LVEEGRKRNKKIIDRCNLTVFFEPGQEDLLEFLKTNDVEVVASLPCYTLENVDKQRGNGVFDKSIAALKMLNEAGFGVAGSSRILNLVYNPGGASLPGNQGELETAYKKELLKEFGIHFNSLFTITNMPIKRFASSLLFQGKLEEYMHLLINSYNPNTLQSVMCTDTLSVGWDGKVYDCDFNQQLGMGLMGLNQEQTDGTGGGDHDLTVFDLALSDEPIHRSIPISVGRHCFGCVAGCGSSCQGAIN
jgi:radical SAM/Cys-rich protein